MVLRNAFPDYVCTDAEMSKIVELTGDTSAARLGFTYSDLTQRLIPSVILDAFPNLGINAELILKVASETTPTPAFSEAVTSMDRK